MKIAFAHLKTSAFLCCLLAASAFAQEAKKADALSPEDVGFTKYIFQSQAPKGFVVVFRKDEYEDDRLIRRYETISSNPGGEHAEKLLFIDWTMLRGKSTYELKTDTSDEELPPVFSVKQNEFINNPPMAKFVFEKTEHGTKIARTYIFTMINERYEDVKKRIPSLDAMSAGSWTYAYDYHLGNK